MYTYTYICICLSQTDIHTFVYISNLESKSSASFILAISNARFKYDFTSCFVTYRPPNNTWVFIAVVVSSITKQLIKLPMQYHTKTSQQQPILRTANKFDEDNDLRRSNRFVFIFRALSWFLWYVIAANFCSCRIILSWRRRYLFIGTEIDREFLWTALDLDLDSNSDSLI